MSRLPVIAAALLSLPSLHLSAQATSSQRTEIQQFVRNYIDAENRADVTAMMDMISRGADVSSISDGEITRGWEAIRKDNDEVVGKEGSYRISLGSMDVSALGSGYALVVAPITLTLATQQGAAQIRGALTLVLHRETGGWKIVNEHYSTKPPTQ